MEHKSERKKISFIEAIVLLILYVLIFAVGIGKYPTGMSILFCASVTTAYAIFILNFKWSEIFSKIMEMFQMGLPSILVLLMVGFISSAWLASGTIPTLIVYGLKILNPSIFLLASFIITTIVSIATGSSWSTVATFGLALMGVARGMGIPVGLAGGAIVSGCWLGDKWSPFSDTTNLAAAVTGQDVFEVFKYNIPTSGFGGIIAAVVFAIIGIKYAGTSVNTANVDLLVQNIENLYTINIFMLIPVVIVIVLAVIKKPVLPSLALATATAVLLAVFVQGFKAADIIKALYNGYITSSGVEQIDKLLSGGGLTSVSGIILIIFCAFVFAGSINEVGVMQAIASKMGALSKKRGPLVIISLLTGVFGSYMGGTAYTGVILSSSMFEDSYEKLGLSKLDLARTILEGSGHTSALVPWCGSHVMIVASLSITWSQFLPYYYSLWASVILTIIYGFTGWFTTKKKKDSDESIAVETKAESV